MIRMVFTSEGFFEVAIESWSEWDFIYIYIYIYIYMCVCVCVCVCVYICIYIHTNFECLFYKSNIYKL